VTDSPAAAVQHLTGVTGGEVLVAALAAHGVEVVFGIPGTHNLSIFDALHRHGVRVVATTHEQGAGYAADGYARTCHRPGVAVVTSGPAVYNALTALAQAYSDSSPVLLVSPSMPRDLPGGTAGTGFLHEAKDQSGVLDRVAEISLRAGDHQAIVDVVDQAFLRMKGGRPRPVHVEVPLDLLEELGDARVETTGLVAWAPPYAGTVSRAGEVLLAADRVVIVAGGGARIAGEHVTALAELLGAPVVTTINGTGVVPSDHPLGLGSRLGLRPVHDAVEAADVLVVVGSELARSDAFLGPLSPRGTVVRLDVDARMSDVNVEADVMIVGHAIEGLSALRDELASRGLDEPVPVPQWATELRAAAQAAARESGARWLRWLDALQQELDDDVVLATDNAMCVYYGAIPNLVVRRASSLHFPTGFGTLGFTVPVAIGAAIAAPDRQVVGISGDGGLLFTVTELACAAAERLPIAVVVFDNGGYGEIRNEMLDRGAEPVAVAAPPRDLVLLAQALGCTGVRVESPEALATEVRAARSRTAPTVIVVPEPLRSTGTKEAL
jgi:thiamine pyrophosphate-dependent acetolactate synthase large subunit-like protein